MNLIVLIKITQIKVFILWCTYFIFKDIKQVNYYINAIIHHTFTCYTVYALKNSLFLQNISISLIYK